MVDNKAQLLHFVLDTSEIKVNHTSENLLIHVKKVIDKFNLESNVNDVVIKRPLLRAPTKNGKGQNLDMHEAYFFGSYMGRDNL